jgi:hypothetical protein
MARDPRVLASIAPSVIACLAIAPQEIDPREIDPVTTEIRATGIIQTALFGDQAIRVGITTNNRINRILP